MTVDNPWITVSGEEQYDNPWINVTEYQVINPAGNNGIYGKIHFKNIAVGIIPLDKKGYTWLVGQYRYTLDAYSWEIPAGGCPIGTSILETAHRELLEETGISAKKLTPIQIMHLSNSVSDEIAHIFLAEDLTLGTAEPEETEDLKLRYLPFSEAYEMVLRGEITDSISVAAILRTQLLQNKNNR